MTRTMPDNMKSLSNVITFRLLLHYPTKPNCVLMLSDPSLGLSPVSKFVKSPRESDILRFKKTEENSEPTKESLATCNNADA